MFFNPRSLLVGAMALAVSGIATAADCANGPYANVLVVGSSKGGAEWCSTKWDQGVVVTGIEVWASNKAVRAVQLYYSDGTDSPMIGHIDDVKEHQRIDWDPAKDGISQLKSWGDGKGKALGRIYLRLKSGGELNVGKNTDGQNVFETNVASGIMLGAFGHSSDVIDNMGTLFLKSKVDKITVEDVKFKDDVKSLNDRMQGLQNLAIDFADFKNDQKNSTSTFSFARKQTRTITKTYTTAVAQTFGITTGFEISGEILGIGAKTSTTLKYDTTTTDTVSTAEADTRDLTWTITTPVAPGTHVYCRAVAMIGQYKGDYDGTVKVWLEDGSNFTFKQGGELNQVSWSSASGSCQNKPYDDNMATAGPPISTTDLSDKKKRSIRFTA